MAQSHLNTSLPLLLIAHFRHDVVSGAERSIADLVDHIQSDFTSEMLVPKEGNLTAYYRKRGFQVAVKEIQNFRRRYPGLHTIQSFLFARQLKARQVRAVLCNTFSAASRVGTACRFAGVPYAIYIREYISDSPLNRSILAQANQIFVISKDLQTYVSQLVDPQRIRLTYNHINPEPILQRAAAHRSSSTRLLPFPPETPVVGLVGRVAPFKQQDLFVRAVPRVLQEVPQARFVIVGAAQGKDLSYESSVKQQAASLGVQDSVVFLGHRSDNVELMSEMAVTCLTSTREPLGRVILESFLLGIPVVAANTGGSDEIVDAEINGLKFSSTAPDACEQLASQIIRLLKDPALRESLAARAREKVFATFAGDLYTQTQASFIHTLMESNGSDNQPSNTPHHQ